MVVAVKSRKIAYMAVPKAACSSVKAALASIDPDVDVTLDMISKDNTLAHSAYPTMRFRPHRWENYDDFWRFTVVRDPLKRLLAVYTDRVVARGELHNSPRLRRQSELPLDPDPDFFFQNIQKYSELASVIKHHAIPVRLFIGPKPLKYDAIYRVDELGDLQSELSRRVGHDVVIPRFNASGVKLDVNDLEQKTQDTLAGILGQEYDHLSGFFENPFGMDSAMSPGFD